MTAGEAGPKFAGPHGSWTAAYHFQTSYGGTSPRVRVSRLAA